MHPPLKLLNVMKAIRELYTRQGFHHQLIRREGNVAVYKQEKNNYKAFEVVVLRTMKKDNALTGQMTGDERLPSTSDWGVFGWTYRSEDDANRKFEELIAKQK